jgi:hypothetical protein
MVVRVRGARSDRPGSSIREVCLLGGIAGAPGWASGGRLRWAGRSYVIAALEGGHDRPCYAHLAAAPAAVDGGWNVLPS